MMSAHWDSVADLVHRLRQHQAPPQALPIREEGAVVATSEFGPELISELPELVNFGVLARLTLREPAFRVHEMRRPAVVIVANTDLHSLPDEPPELLRRPFIAQVRDPQSERLFGATASLGVYSLDGTTYLIGLDYPDGCRVARWRPTWDGGEIEAGIVREDPGLALGDLEEWGRHAARFVVVLGMLLDATHTPLRASDHGPQLPGRSKGKVRPGHPWAVRRVSISGETARGGGDGGGGPGTTDEDLIARSVMVRGHLKRQHHGAGNKLTRWVYVESYEARRWLTTRPTRVVVS